MNIGNSQTDWKSKLRVTTLSKAFIPWEYSPLVGPFPKMSKINTCTHIHTRKCISPGDWKEKDL